MKNYEATWKALDDQERAIDAKMRQPNLSRDELASLEIKKRKIGICKQALIREFKGEGGGGQNYVAAKPKESQAENEVRLATDDHGQAQARQANLGRDHLRELEIMKWVQRQRGR